MVPLGPETRLLSILPLSHMYGLNPGFLAPMYRGASVVYPTSLQAPVLARTFRERKVTMLLAVPQVVKQLNNAVERRVDADGRRAIFERLHAIAPPPADAAAPAAVPTGAVAARVAASSTWPSAPRP